MKLILREPSTIVVDTKTGGIEFRPYIYLFGEGITLYEKNDERDILARAVLAMTMEDNDEGEHGVQVESLSCLLREKMGMSGLVRFARACAECQVTQLRNVAELESFARTNFEDCCREFVREEFGGFNTEFVESVQDTAKRISKDMDAEYTDRVLLTPAVDCLMKKLVESDAEIHTGFSPDSYKHKRILFDMTSKSGAVYRLCKRVFADMAGVIQE